MFIASVANRLTVLRVGFSASFISIAGFVARV